MSSIDLGRFLNEPIHALDFQVMAGDLKDFLDSSERSIEQLYHLECEAIQCRAETENFPNGYGEHLQLNAEHRFKMSLPLRIRYGALLALTTSVEWAILSLEGNLRESLPKRPKGQNRIAHALAELNVRAHLGQEVAVSDYEALVQVRNCIAHFAGIVGDYKYREDLPKAISRLVGFSIDEWHFIGQHICIQRGALNRYIESTGQLVVTVHRACYEQDLLNLATRSRARTNRTSRRAGWTDNSDGGCPIA